MSTEQQNVVPPKEEGGPCSDAAIPVVDEDTGLILFIMSLFFGALASLIGACLNKGGMNSDALCSGILQACTSPCCCIGIFWAWMHNYNTWQKAKLNKDDNFQQIR